ncbi:MAG: RNA polymerase-binding protein DksA [Alphaproteobacteria bacterium]|jgi:DnaK suppressor protein|nr:RNA polymerase-binding protein DksA [Rhodospirillaceae bacterium]MDP6019931.1 RNA polymerase-binding protein DksA [Alphaproteobacteria bacterium]MDP6253705.1 RNA polymerase-binding protein DksA [Alphaproteobacteria bacterium]MDP7055652.1 RNA polymerase-binding protein DksA [Alphaproteobacteria bacterium]MDP7229286.1 RNA polymerase-binding protein DksA [Alphaproteobacteria bacterium]|tara:strand:+ start:2716 stop:3135 length:420 start_codon:yes stop_codon:yes gene_type:complete
MSEVSLPSNYRPTEKEKFMGVRQQQFFRQRLQGWRDEILRDAQGTMQNLQDDDGQAPDIADRATTESERSIELRTRDRQRKLVIKIDAALERIEDGSYGYCDDTGEPIGLKRLEARPIATLSIEAQERHERRERVHRDE